MPEPESIPNTPEAAKPTRFRFRLRTLLMLVFACAVGTWIYLTGWPWLRAYWEQTRFEQAVRTLKVGDSTYSAHGILTPNNKKFNASYTSNIDHQLTGTSQYNLNNAIYFVHCTYAKGYSGGMMEARSERIEVFRLPPVPKNYKAQRKIYDYPLANRTEPPKHGESPEIAYAADFLQYVTGDRQDDFGLRAELIYSDPPAKP